MKRLATFTIDGAAYGVDVTRVREIVRPQEITPIPLAPPEVAGLINLRGEIVTALDLRIRLGAAARASGGTMNVIMTSPHGPVSLLVDHAGDVLEVDEGTLERAPTTLGGPARDLILGTYQLDGRLLMELDVERTIDETTPSGTDVEVEHR